MNYTIYDYLGLFFFYAFLGWLLETSVAAIRKKHMVNRGFLNGPLCAIYGITAVFMTRYLYELQSSPVPWLYDYRYRSRVAGRSRTGTHWPWQMVGLFQ